MNTRITQTIFALAVVVLLASASQAQTVRATAQIPFDFKVVDMVLPAGGYALSNLSLPAGVLCLRSKDGKKIAVTNALRAERLVLPEHGFLVFNRYRGNGGEEVYFLSEIWMEGQNVGHQFIKGPDEKAAALRAAQRDMITIVLNKTQRAAR